MKIQSIQSPFGLRPILLDDDYNRVYEVNEFLKYLDSTQKTKKTIYDYANSLKAYVTWLYGYNIRVGDIFNYKDSYMQVLENYLLYLRNQYSPSSINTMMAPVKSMYEYLTISNYSKSFLYKKEVRIPEDEKCSFLSELTSHKKKEKDVLRIKVHDERYEYNTREECYVLRDACNNRRDKILISVLFEAGVRIGEALGLRLQDLELYENQILLVNRIDNENDSTVKGGAEGALFIPDYLVQEIIDFITIDLADIDTEYLFVNLYCGKIGKAMSKSNVEKLFKRLCKKTGLKVHPHMLRHGYGTEHAEAGEDILIIQKNLRHKRLSSTKKYINMSNEKKSSTAGEFYKEQGMAYGEFRNYVNDDAGEIEKSTGEIHKFKKK